MRERFRTINDFTTLGRPYFSDDFGNASSRAHPYGWKADAAISDARLELLNFIGARSPDEIVFTSDAKGYSLTIRDPAKIYDVTIATPDRRKER